jgi:hypothetical protein
MPGQNEISMSKGYVDKWHDSGDIPLKPRWKTLATRLQKSATREQGIGIITIHIVIQNEQPVAWTCPHLTHFEPTEVENMGEKWESLIRIFTGGV